MPKIVDVVFDANATAGNVIPDFKLKDKYVIGNKAYLITQGYAPATGAFIPNFSYPITGNPNTAMYHFDINFAISIISDFGATGIEFDYDSTATNQWTYDTHKLLATNPFQAKLGRSKRTGFLQTGESEYLATGRYKVAINWFYYTLKQIGDMLSLEFNPSVTWSATANYGYQGSLFYKDSNGNWHSIATRLGYYAYYKKNYYYNDTLSLINGSLIAKSNASFYNENAYKVGFVPVFICETDAYVYFFYSTIAQADQTFMRLEKATGNKTVANILTRATACPAIASYISKPKDNGDGTYSWYKVVADTTQDTVPLVIKRYTFNPTDESFTIEDCTISDVTIDYSNNGSSTPLQAFNLEEVEINGNRYLYLFVFNMFNPIGGDYDDYSTKYTLTDDAVKVYCWQIGDDNVTLTPVGTKSYPITNVRYLDFIDRDNPDLGLLMVGENSVCNVSLTGDSSLFTVNWIYSFAFTAPVRSLFGEYFNPAKVDIDVYGNFILSVAASKKKIFLFGDNILEKINLQFEKDDYSNDDLPISTYVTVNPVNFKNETIPTRIGLTIRSDNAYWTDNNSRYIEVDVTQPTNVNLTITARGRVYVTAKAIKEL